MAERKASGLSGVVSGATGAVGETLKTAGTAAGEATGAVSDVTGAKAVESVGEGVQQATGTAGAALEQAGRAGPQRSLREELREIVREAALEVLVPMARSATRQAAIYAVRRAPELARDTLAPRLNTAIQEAGGPGPFAKGALSSLSGARAGLLERMRGGEPPARSWRERPVPVEESIDVGVPLETAYERFIRFDDYANLMSRGEAVEQRPNERIAWKRTDGVEDSAVITFHRMSDRLTRVMVDYDHPTHGVLEMTTSLLRTTPRSVRGDLMRFKALVEMSPEQDRQQADGPREHRNEGE